MSLFNLVRIGRLHPLAPNPRAIRRMLASARVSLKDAQSESTSADSRFDAVREAILACTPIGLWVAGALRAARPDIIRLHCKHCRSARASQRPIVLRWTSCAATETARAAMDGPLRRR